MSLASSNTWLKKETRDTGKHSRRNTFSFHSYNLLPFCSELASSTDKDRHTDRAGLKTSWPQINLIAKQHSRHRGQTEHHLLITPRPLGWAFWLGVYTWRSWSVRGFLDFRMVANTGKLEGKRMTYNFSYTLQLLIPLLFSHAEAQNHTDCTHTYARCMGYWEGILCTDLQDVHMTTHADHQSRKVISPMQNVIPGDKHLHFGKPSLMRTNQRKLLPQATLRKQQSSEPVNKSSCDYADDHSNARQGRKNAARSKLD